MRQEENGDFVLGEEVTSAARRSRSRSAGAVLSVRLTAGEVAEIEAISRAEGRTVSQVVRDALRRHVRAAQTPQPRITISTLAGTLSTGWQAQTSHPNLV